MKFTATSSELQRALAKVGGVIPSKSTLPILENILFHLVSDTLTITATDMEISLTVSLQVKGKEDGKAAIPAKRLLDTVRSLPPDTTPTFSIEASTNKVTIATANGHYSLTGESAEEFPPNPQFKETDEIVLDNASLRNIIHRTSFAVSTDELRPAMMGVLLQPKGSDLRAVSTDGHRLVKLTQKLPKGVSLKRDVIIPAKALNLVGKSIETGESTVSLSETHVRFAFDKTIVISRLIDEVYPNYESVIPQDNTKIMSVDREQTIASLRRVALYASATTHQVKFGVKNTLLTLSAQDIDFGGEAKETIECEYKGEDIEIGFNSNYVIDILSHMDADQIAFKFSAPTRAGIVTPVNVKNGEDIIMLVMPVRLNA